MKIDFDALAQERQRMAMAERRRAAGQRDVDGAAGGRGRCRRDDPRVELRLDLLLELVGELAEPRPLVGRRRPERLEQAETSPPLRAR